MSPRMTKKFNAKFSYSTRHTQIVDRISDWEFQSHESSQALERKFAIQRISINFFSALSPPSSHLLWESSSVVVVACDGRNRGD